MVEVTLLLVTRSNRLMMLDIFLLGLSVLEMLEVMSC